MTRTDHWNAIYSSKRDEDVSWFEPAPDASIDLIEASGLDARSCVIDIGGGNSRLVDVLLAKGLTCLAVLDVSAVALSAARARLGSAADSVRWIEADVTGEWSAPRMNIWHDRAVFHFLTAEADRAAYQAHLAASLEIRGHAIIATFAPDGPGKCSGLPVARYSPETLAAELGPRFSLVESRPHRHTTPWGASQSFQYSRFVRLA